jgi:hypothetical protein
MKGLVLEFDDLGGYDSMTGAWTIYKNDKVLLYIDQSHFGQEPNDHEFRSVEARRIAMICYEALLEARD